MSDMFSVCLRRGMFNRRSQHRETRLYLLAIYAHRKGDSKKEDYYYYQYLLDGRSSASQRTLAGALS